MDETRDGREKEGDRGFCQEGFAKDNRNIASLTQG